MSETKELPTPEHVAAQIESCRRELAALRRLYKVCKAARDADQERQGRKGAGNA